MTMQEKIKMAFGELMLNQIAMADNIEQLKDRIAALSTPPAASLSGLAGTVQATNEGSTQ